MKGLLHSKKFRTNLYKWLFLYVGVMMLFTSVVTYSRYITSLQTDEQSRVASFEVGIDYMNCKNVATNDTKRICNSGDYRPTSEMKYYFTIDTTKLEVNSLFVLSITVKPEFKVLGLKRDNKAVDITGINNNVIRLQEQISAGEGGPSVFELTVLYQGNDIVYNKEQTIQNLVKIGYSATQIK